MKRFVPILLILFLSISCSQERISRSINTIPANQQSSLIPPKKETPKVQLSPTPTRQPPPLPKSSEITKSNCDPNYTGCVPIASDVDCAGGKGNGPAYVKGPIKVIGVDIYELDRNRDGIACE